MNEQRKDQTLQTWVMAAVAGSCLLAGTAAAQSDPANLAEAGGVYEVIETNNESDHSNAIVTLARTERGNTESLFKRPVYGLGFIQSNAQNAQRQNEGILCDRAQVLDNQRRTAGCFKSLVNQNGEQTGIESLRVGTLNSAFCSALRSNHGSDIILLSSEQRCDADGIGPDGQPLNDKCICYEIDIDTGAAPFGPPSEGTGTARKGGGG